MTSSFDVRAYVREPIDLRPASLDLEAMADLPGPVRDAVVHLWSVERSILDLMRDLLVTPTHAEARVTAFLSTWAYEQYWIAESLSALLQTGGAPEPADPPDSALGTVRRHWDERVRPTVDAVRTNLLGSDVVAAHMVTGWLSTATMDLAYRRLSLIEPRLHPLTTIVTAIKERHLAFYADEARTRLRGSAGAVRLARRAAAHWQWPGVRHAGHDAAAGPVRTLLADPSARPGVEAVDAALAQLPGLGGYAPLRRALGAFVPRSPADGTARAATRVQ
ncbi:hypothetical protein LQF12_00615 [Ruania suaedae]|uniref:hypothetical protein n=1 Tax=Ruania suaedae TaxID=2897774 RepID=UPI001E395439|nr:hypothetical protein [Ruania suaedae]UFU03150.1 hypothetical protein LQF12_00615 [Ruania suaedae]